MPEVNAYERFHQELDATAVLSPDFKSRLSAWAGKMCEQALAQGRKQGKTLAAREDADARRRVEDTLALVQERRDELLRANADLQREVQMQRTRLEVVSDRRDELLREVAEKCCKITSLEGTLEVSGARYDRLLRERCEEAGCERGVQRCSQPRVDCIADGARDDFNDATPQERDAIKRARSLGVVSTRLRGSIELAQESGLDACQITPARLRDLGARAFVLARRRDGFGS